MPLLSLWAFMACSREKFTFTLWRKPNYLIYIYIYNVFIDVMREIAYLYYIKRHLFIVFFFRPDEDSVREPKLFAKVKTYVKQCHGSGG